MVTLGLGVYKHHATQLTSGKICVSRLLTIALHVIENRESKYSNL